VLLDVNGDEIRASEVLLRQLLGVGDSNGETTDDDDVWAEEQEPIKEILSNRFVVVDPSTCRIQLSPPNSTNLPRNITIEFRKPSHYPNGLPPHIVVLCEPKLPAHVRLSLLRQAGMYAWESLRGMGMVYSLSDWIEENIGRIVAHPGRLTDIDGVTTGEAVQPLNQTVAVTKKSSRKIRGIDWTPGTSIAQKPVPEFRKALPAWKHRGEVVSITRKNRVTVVTGETGSGKSTQIPQFLLDDHLIRGLSQAVNIVCTQPRRISAIGLAERVSDERSEKVGATIGYSIRGETKSSRDTKLQFVTTGVLLRRFLDNPELMDISHVIVDEVHERTVDGDFLLLLLKQLLSRRKDFNVILMSATVEAETFVSYFSDFSVGRIHVEGRTFPVQDIYLESILRFTGYRPPMRKVRRDRDEVDFDEYDEGLGAALKILNEGLLDYDLIAKTVQHVCASNVDNGGILIFLPGILVAMH
jgi:ATP-dependent RNA helicase DHX57